MTTGKGHGSQFHTKREAAVLALLELGHVEEAAKKIGVSVSTLARWMKTEAFQSVYAEARRQVFEIGLSRLQALSGEAIETLRCNLTATRPMIQVRAATAILLHATRAAELLDITDRLAKLEAMQETKP